MTKKTAKKTWWDLACDLNPDMSVVDIISDPFMPDSLYNQYKKVRDTEGNTIALTSMTNEEIFMAMCFLSYIYDPKE